MEKWEKLDKIFDKILDYFLVFIVIGASIWILAGIFFGGKNGVGELEKRIADNEKRGDNIIAELGNRAEREKERIAREASRDTKYYDTNQKLARSIRERAERQEKIINEIESEEFCVRIDSGSVIGIVDKQIKEAIKNKEQRSDE
jgi:hypothetical protein